MIGITLAKWYLTRPTAIHMLSSMMMDSRRLSESKKTEMALEFLQYIFVLFIIILFVVGFVQWCNS